MSRELLESILNKDYVSANELFEQKISDIQEKKMYEVKRMVAVESTGKSRLQQDREDLASGKKRRASDVYPDPRASVIKPEKRRKAAPASVIRKSPEEKDTAYKIGYGIGRTIKGVGQVAKGTGKVAKGAWSLWGDILRSGSSGNLEE